MRHPAHPMLTDVTIAAWSGAVILDFLGEPGAAETFIGVGALSALPTALTGWNDFSDITDARTRRIGLVHAIGNVTSLALFCSSYVARRRNKSKLGVVLSGTGMGVLTAAGFLGGDLSFRRGVGVDQTVTEAPIRSWTPVMDADDLATEAPRRVRVERTDVMLYRTDGKIYALANRCSHRGGPLHKGRIADGCVTCPWHLSTFRIDDGEIVRGPATAPQRSYDVRVHDGKIEIRSRDA
jgi:nitrite reductase/ring-hydroxylating ferredoxin subunit/uncharacterized membrane protein